MEKRKNPAAGKRRTLVKRAALVLLCCFVLSLWPQPSELYGDSTDTIFTGVALFDGQGRDLQELDAIDPAERFSITLAYQIPVAAEQNALPPAEPTDGTEKDGQRLSSGTGDTGEMQTPNGEPVLPENATDESINEKLPENNTSSGAETEQLPAAPEGNGPVNPSETGEGVLAGFHQGQPLDQQAVSSNRLMLLDSPQEDEQTHPEGDAPQAAIIVGASYSFTIDSAIDLTSAEQALTIENDGVMLAKLTLDAAEHTGSLVFTEDALNYPGHTGTVTVTNCAFDQSVLDLPTANAQPTLFKALSLADSGQRDLTFGLDNGSQTLRLNFALTKKAETVEPLPGGFFTDVKLTIDNKPVDAATKIEMDQTFKVHYYFKMPSTFKPEDYQKSYCFTLPDALKLGDDFDIPLTAQGDKDPFAKVHVAKDSNQATLTFVSDKAQYISDADFYIEAGFNQDKVQAGENVIIFWPHETAATTVTVKIKPKDPIAEVELNKPAGNVDLNNFQISWIVNVKPTVKNMSADKIASAITDFVFTDALAGDHTYVEDSIQLTDVTEGAEKATEVAIATQTISADGKQLTCTVENGKIQSGHAYQLQYKTQFAIGAFNNKETVQFNNEAKVLFKIPAYEAQDVMEPTGVMQITKGPVKQTCQVTGKLLDKTGALEAGTLNEIKWTLKLNSGAFTITGGKVVDTLPERVTLDENSVMIDGTKTEKDSGWTIEGRTLTFNVGDLSGAKTITYVTKIADGHGLSDSFTNSAQFTGSGDPGFRVTKNYTVPVGTWLFTKSDGLYNRSTHEMGWTLMLNNKQAAFDQAYTVEDPLPEGLSITKDEQGIPLIYQNGSTSGEKEALPCVKTGDSAPTDKIYFEYTAKTDETKRDVIVIHVPQGVSGQTHTVSYTTSVDAPTVYGANKLTTFSNTATVQIGGEKLSISQPSFVTSQMISKGTNKGYDVANKRVSWKIMINQNEMPVEDAVVTDTPEETLGQKVVADSLRIDNQTLAEFNKNNKDAKAALTVAEDGRQFTVTFAKINAKHTITYETELTDLEGLYNNQAASVSNSATFTGKGLPTSKSEEISQTVGMGIVDKYCSSESVQGEEITWQVIVNKNLLDLQNPILTDTLAEALTLDLESVKLYEATVDSKGQVKKGQEIPVGPENISYNTQTHVFQFDFKMEQMNEAYWLVFTTLVAPETEATFNNSVQLNCKGHQQSDESGNIAFQWASFGGSGSGSRGQLLLHKQDKTGQPLAGAEFTLVNTANGLIQTATTNEQGEATFAGLRNGGTYTLTETKAPEGYYIDQTEPIKVQVRAKQNVFMINGESKTQVSTEPLVLTNPQIKGGMTVTKVAAGTEKPLAGAVFALYQAQYPKDADAQWMKMGDSVTTGDDGLAQWTDLPYGHYYIAEEAAPRGYYQSIEPYQFEVTANGQQLTYNWPNTKRHTGGGGGGIIGGHPGEEENVPVPVPPVPAPEKPLAPIVPPVPPVDTPQEPSLAPSTEGPIDPGTMDKVIEEIVTPDTPLAGKVDVPKGGQAELNRPPFHGTADVQPDGHWQYTPERGFNGRDQFVIVVSDAQGNEEFILMDMEVPLAGMLPQTGEASRLPIYLAGLFCLAAGCGLWLSRKPHREEER